MRRRTLLTTATVTIPLAGCLSSSSSDSDQQHDAELETGVALDVGQWRDDIADTGVPYSAVHVAAEAPADATPPLHGDMVGVFQNGAQHRTSLPSDATAYSLEQSDLYGVDAVDAKGNVADRLEGVVVIHPDRGRTDHHLDALDVYDATADRWHRVERNL